MADSTSSIVSDLVTQSVNFHGHELLKELTVNRRKWIQTLELENIDYKVYQARFPEISKQLKYGHNRSEFLYFISDKAEEFFSPYDASGWSEDKPDQHGFIDKQENFPPVEYYMDVAKDIRKTLFFKNAKRGDILHTKVTGLSTEKNCILKVIASLGSTIRELSGVDIKAVLLAEDTSPDTKDCNEAGNWLPNTRLCVEVLKVTADSQFLQVGTKGVTLSPQAAEEITLGKITMRDYVPLVSDMKRGKVKPYHELLEKLETFTNPRSIRHMASKFGINTFKHSSAMNSLKHTFAENQMYRPLRRAQLSRWAHKSVADGVSFFKKGQHEEAFQCLSKALQIDSENVEAFVAKGALLANLGRFEKAVDDFEHALKYDPSHKNARKYICETLVEFGKQLEEEKKYDDAQKRYEQCLEINPKHAGAQDALISIKRYHHIQESGTRIPSETVMETEAPYEYDTTIPLSNQFRQKSKSRSLSPLAKKFALQEGQWHPPPSINTTASFMTANSAVSTTDQKYHYPVEGCHPNYYHSSVSSAIVAPPPDFSQPPPPYPQPLMQGNAHVGSYTSREDEEYKAQVEKFLKEVGSGSFRPKKKKDRHKKNHTKEHTSRSKKKHRRESRKRSKRKRSSSSSSGSSSSSSHNNRRRSRSRSRGSSHSSSSSSSSSSRSSSSGSSQSVSKKKKKKKRHTTKKKKTYNESKKSEKKKLAKENGLETISTVSTNAEDIEKENIPGLNVLQEKLSAYYKKIQESSVESKEIEEDIPELDSLEEKINAYLKKVDGSRKPPDKRESEKSDEKSDGICSTSSLSAANRYDCGFHLPSKKPSSHVGVKDIHPAFRDSEEEVIPNESLQKIISTELEDDKCDIDNIALGRKTSLSLSKETGDSVRRQPSDELSKCSSKDPLESHLNVHSKQKSESVSSRSSQSRSSISQSLQSSKRRSRSRQRSQVRSKSPQSVKERSRSYRSSQGRSRSRQESSGKKHSPQRAQANSRSHWFARSPSPEHSGGRSRPHNNSQARSAALYHAHSRSHPHGVSSTRSRLRNHSRSRSRSNDRSDARSRSPNSRTKSYSLWYKKRARQNSSSRSSRKRSRSRSRHRSDGRSPSRKQHSNRSGSNRSSQPRSRSHNSSNIKSLSRSKSPSVPRHESNSQQKNFNQQSTAEGKENSLPVKVQSKWDTPPPRKLRSRWDSPPSKQTSTLNSNASKTPGRPESSHPKTPSRWDSSHPKTPSHLESFEPKTPGRWESSHPKTPNRWDSLQPKTPSRWDSLQPKTPRQWESSEPKTPRRWESSHPKTPNRWESFEPKTPGRWESSQPKTPKRWESSHPKTPSRWESSEPKTPGRWESSQPKTPKRWESSHPKTPSRWDSSHPKTPGRWESSEPKTPGRESSSLKTPSRWNLSEPKTPGRESSHLSTPSQWESYEPKTPGRESSRHKTLSPKTPGRWESSEPKTPGRESSHHKTLGRWDMINPKTRSQWESSEPKTPGRGSSHSKTPSGWESSHPKTPSRLKSCLSKTSNSYNMLGSETIAHDSRPEEEVSVLKILQKSKSNKSGLDFAAITKQMKARNADFLKPPVD